jgi:hypothetical protein
MSRRVTDQLLGPDLIPNGGHITASHYIFAPDQGLILSNGVNPSNYSIEVQLSFDNISNWKKIIDYKDRGSDYGLYNYNSALQFYPNTAGPAGAFSAFRESHVVLTRNAATLQTVGYVNATQQIAFTDAGGIAVFSGPANVIHFFIDDYIYAGESSSGTVERIRIFDTPLGTGEVAFLYAGDDPIPEPVAMLALGAALLCRLRRCDPD